MGYHVVDPADIDPTTDHPCDRRSITETTGLTTLALTVYELAPGDELATMYHSHEDREEALCVLSGELWIETPERTYVVDTNEIFVVEPESPIRPYNPLDADQSVRVIGTGAPLYDMGQPYEP